MLTSAYGLGAFGMLGASPLTPSLVDGFALSRLDVAFIVPSVYIGGLLFSLPGGHLADRWGVRPTLLGALAVGGAGLLAAALAPRFALFLLCLVVAGSGWSVHVAQSGSEVVGFVAVRLDASTQVGEIGLNAVDPARAGNGIGTAMYELAVARMREAGMKVATVATGGDPSHAPARRAYRKAGFDAEIPSDWMCRKL